MTRILGILNVTPNSFSDGGRYLEPTAAIAHASSLMTHADAVDLGAASSHPDSPVVGAAVEMQRLQPVLQHLVERDVPVSVDSFEPQVQQWAAANGARWVNDIHGFPDADTRRALADSPADFIAMFAIQQRGNATREHTDDGTIVQRIVRFFDERLNDFERDGIDRSRVTIDPGMGFFLGSTPGPSVEVLRAIPMLRARYDRPVLVSVSRKSFLRKLTGATLDTMQPATLAGEVVAGMNGADWLRTHEPTPLRMALDVVQAVRG